MTSDNVDPDAVRKGILERLGQPMPAEAMIELDTCAMIDKLDISLRCLRTALENANQSLGLPGLPDENDHQTEAVELRRRWCAAIQLLSAAIATVEADGVDVIKAVKTMLAIS